MTIKQITLDDVMCRIQQAQTVLSFWRETMTTDDGSYPDIVDAVAIEMDKPSEVNHD
ncbi:hypothetical protein ACVQFM_003607 [Yersinia enterocolitica]